jgi:hypothetical protein
VFDLSIYPIAYVDGQEQGSLPGVFAAPAPRRAARGRPGELLVLYLTLQGNAPLSAEGMQQMLEKLSQLYFQTAGSVTMALRTAADTLNNYLLERNLKNASAGKQAVGLLNMLVVRAGTVIIANCGPAHTFVLGDKAVEHFADSQQAGRGLGLTRTLSVRFYQTELKGNPYLVLSANPPSIWASGGLSSGPAASVEVVKRRLLSQAQPNLAAVVVQLQPGTGKIAINARPALVRPEAQPAAPAASEPPSSVEVPAGEKAPSSSDSIPPQAAAPVTLAPPVVEASQPAVLPLQSQPVPAAQPPAKPARRSRRPAKTTPEPAIHEIKRPPVRPVLFRSMGRALDAWTAFRLRLGNGFRKLIGRLSPTGTEPSLRLSTSTMLFIAIAVPLVVVAVAVAVYLERGRGARFDYYLSQAQAAAHEAVSQSQPAEARSAWRQTLYMLDQAETYKRSNDTRALKNQATEALDTLDWVERIDMQPAIVGGLADTIQVTQMVATASDLYMLDGVQGRVLHAVLTNQGYEMDASFACNPGQVGGLLVGPLVDIIPLPIGNDRKAALMGIDNAGSLLMCTPGEPQDAISLAPPPLNWAQINHLRLFSYTLYVLDPPNNVLHEFDGYDTENNRLSLTFSSAPESFFGKNSPSLEDAVDLSVDTQDIYFLHADGQLTHCLYSIAALVDTTCDPRSSPVDPRPGYDVSAPAFGSTHFSQMVLTQPPVPSIYLLDSETTNIYQFNMRLELHRVLALDQDTQAAMKNQKATAFAINPNRMIFVALGNSIFYGFLP